MRSCISGGRGCDIVVYTRAVALGAGAQMKIPVGDTACEQLCSLLLIAPVKSGDPRLGAPFTQQRPKALSKWLITPPRCRGSSMHSIVRGRRAVALGQGFSQGIRFDTYLTQQTGGQLKNRRQTKVGGKLSKDPKKNMQKQQLDLPYPVECNPSGSLLL